ncbi:UDP-N-acetylmuramoyl-tripeptide--D-alanyl-D-alanine ligase [Aeromicrobium sp. Leaf350]|uniref:UDP-N-acetylmuramoyl-tripeptide--D-alanyl-D- alanine ligase n=1 Tax=Aeromicrobium sp. Leaf350 TaxID=2876565 RepID=UPI001E5FD72C|nr:UDP-N-acetylmuramoyl-tripeptide--D-alanyl-D-alanine ligase [Aeromicrobium sp. Leaf350]
MIPLTIDDLARVVDGRVVGDGSTAVTAPAVIDSREVQPGGLFAALSGEHADGHDFVAAAASGGAAVALVERELPGSTMPLVVVSDVTAALGRLARHVHDVLSAGGLTTIALTGSAGKTSTKDLLAHLLEAEGPTVAPQGSFNNEWGVPLTVLRATPATRFLVVEMGARGIGHIATLCAITPPDVAAVLNVGSAHVGEFGGLDDTARAKGEIVEALAPTGTAVLNLDDVRVRAMAGRTRAHVLGFGQDPTSDVRLTRLELDPSGFPALTLEHGGRTVDVVLPQLGLHHGANAAAAVSMAVAVGIDFTVAAERLASAAARSPHRMARHVTDDGVVVVDDAYNANPESMAAAVSWLAAAAGERGVAVLGPMLELGSESEGLHRAVGELAARSGLRAVVAVGPEAAPIAEAAGSIGTVVADVTEAVSHLRASLRRGDVVLVKASRSCRLERVADALR